MNVRWFLIWHFPSPAFGITAILLAVLAGSSLVFGSEIHDAARNGDVEKVKSLLQANPSLVSSKDENGNLPLHSASSRGQTEVAAVLLAGKADPNAKGQNGGTPLHAAAAGGCREAAEMLLAKGADPNARNNNGQTPLWDALHSVRMEKAEVGGKTLEGPLFMTVPGVTAGNKNDSAAQGQQGRGGVAAPP